MTGGRLVLGIGTGYAESEHEALNLELRPPGPRVERLQESLSALRSLLDSGSVEMRGSHHRLAISDLGVRPVQDHMPFLVGGHGRRVIQVAAHLADTFQFTGLTHGRDGTPTPGGFTLDELTARADWLSQAAADRQVERSILVQRAVINDSVDDAVYQASRRLGLLPEVVKTTPFLLFGSVPEIVDRLQHLRDTLGISHVVVREAAEFAPVVAALSGR